MSQTLLFLGCLIAGFVILAFLVKKWISDANDKSQVSDELLSWLKMTSHRMDDQNRTFTGLLQGNTQALNERLDNAARVISQVQKNIGEMSEIGRGMKDLQDFLRSPKLRGNIGEQVLKELLAQMLPKQAFYLQYGFKSGAIVDAAIKTTNGIIPIDSKFPLENFRRLTVATTDADKDEARRDFVKDVKKHVNDIATKYILSEEGTIDYALMYIPAEAVYYEIVNEPELTEYAYSKRVLPVSPMTFYAYMKTILISFEGQKIEERAKEILVTLRSVRKDYGKVEESLGVLNRHLGNAYNQMNNVLGGFAQLGHKLSSTREIAEEIKTDPVGEQETLLP